MIYHILKKTGISGVGMAVWKTEGFHDNDEIKNPRECADLRNNDSQSIFRVLGQGTTSTNRVLTQEEMDKLGDEALVPDFKQIKLEKEAQKNWDLFYKRNSTNFFKDRHWTTREFEELKAWREVSMWRINPSRLTVSRCSFAELKELSFCCTYFHSFILFRSIHNLSKKQPSRI